MEQSVPENYRNNELIYKNATVRIFVGRTPNPAVVDLLKQTVYGTSGVQYQHTGQEEKVNALKSGYFFHLLIGDKLIGVYCLDERQIEINQSCVKGFYGRYLAVADEHKSKGYGSLLKEEAVRYVETRFPKPYVLYSYIEEKNSRSLNISTNEGFQSVSKLKTFIFRRYRPQVDLRVKPLATEDLDQMLTLLKEYYQRHTFKTFAHIGYQQSYFVLWEGGQIVAGVQANRVCWRFLNMPGIDGWALMNLAPLSSVTRRFFNPSQYAFAVLEGVYLKDGRQDLLATLLEGILAHFKLNSLMWLIDTKDPLLILLTKKAMGPLCGIKRDVSTHVMVKSAGLSENLLVTQQPHYVSCFDYS